MATLSVIEINVLYAVRSHCVVNSQLATRRTLLTALRFNHAPPQPAHQSSLSVYPPLLSSSSLVGPLPCSFSNLPQINTNIHPSKQTRSCMHHIHCTFTAFSNSLFIHRHPASLWGYPTQSIIQVPPTLQTSSSAPSILAPCSPLNTLPRSTTWPTTTNLTSSHLPKHGFVALQHLPS